MNQSNFNPEQSLGTKLFQTKTFPHFFSVNGVIKQLNAGFFVFNERKQE